MPPDPDLVASRPGKWRPSTGRRLAERPQLCVSSDSANFPYLRHLGFISDSPVRDSTCPPRYSPAPDRKSTRLNSSHVAISYAVFCLKKKKPVTAKASYSS